MANASTARLSAMLIAVVGSFMPAPSIAASTPAVVGMPQHALAVGALPDVHRDPFDRIMTYPINVLKARSSGIVHQAATRHASV